MYLQVIYSFLLSAYLPLVFIVFSYLAGLVPKGLLSTADTKFFNAKYRELPQWHRTLVKAILLFSDQQIVTGIAIMVAVYVRLDTTSVYHFRIATFLSWMSSNTHLTTLVVLRKHLMQSRVLRVWRISGMVALYCMLLVALIPGCLWDWERLTKGHSAKFVDHDTNTTFYYNQNLPARCIFFPPTKTVENPGASAAIIASENSNILGWRFNVILVTLLYILKAGLLFKNVSQFIFVLFRAKPLYFIEQRLKHSANAIHQHGIQNRNTLDPGKANRKTLFVLKKMRYRLLMSSYILVTVFLDYIESFIGNLMLLAFGTVWGSIQIMRSSLSFKGDDSQESAWGFGQILPMMLLLLPIVSVLDSFFGQ